MRKDPGAAVSDYQIRFSVDVRAVDDRSKPRDWHGDFVRVNIEAKSFEDAIQKVSGALQALVAGPKCFGILFVDSGESLTVTAREVYGVERLDGQTDDKLRTNCWWKVKALEPKKL